MAIGVLDEETAWDVLEEVPPCTAGLLVLLEHRWAIGLRDAIARAGGFGWRRSSSARSTWSPSAWWGPGRPRRWPPSRATPSEPISNRAEVPAHSDRLGE